MLAQKGIRRHHRPHPTQAQFLRQPALPGAEAAFTAPARLWRVRRNHAHPQLARRTPHLRETVVVHRLSGLGRQPEMTGAIAVQSAKHAPAFDHFFQPCQHRHRRFLFHQLRVINLAVGVVHNYQQVVPALILEPAMLAALSVRKHPRQRSPRTQLAMHSPFAALRHHPGPLQQSLHPAVADLDLVFLLQLLVKVPHVQIEILLPIQPQHFLHHRQWHLLGRRFPSPPVKQPPEPELFIPFMPAPHLPVADPDDLGRLPPRDLLRQRPQNQFLYLHRPLHRGLRVRDHAFHALLPSPPAKRTLHLLSQPDISCANDSDFTWSCPHRLFPLLCRAPSDFLSYYPTESGSRCFLGHFAQEGLPLFARQELEEP